jgi:hypothetical protein
VPKLRVPIALLLVIAHTFAATTLTSVNAWTFLTFSQWQTGTPLVNGNPLAMNEDAAGTAAVNPGFGNAGSPADYLLTSSPVVSFDTKTNDTIRNAGRNRPVIVRPPVPHTYPACTFTKF